MKKFPEPFLYLPFKRQPYEIAEGWLYSPAERSIHGREKHHGIDFRLSKGTPISAVADGWAIASYYWFPVKDEGEPVLYQRKEIGLGYGYFVQIYHPNVNLYTLYGHLERVAEEMDFHKPRKSGEILWPVGNKVLGKKLLRYKHTVKVQKGQVVGYVGDSGLTWGYLDYPKRPDPGRYPSWDEIHLHFEVFERYGKQKNKRIIDPYGIKSQAEDYPDFSKKGSKIGTENPVLWVVDESGKPKFVD